MPRKNTQDPNGDYFICLYCQEVKNRSEYFKSSLKKKYYRCKECLKIYMQDYKNKHTERVNGWRRLSMRRWRENNPELNKQMVAEQKLKHRDNINFYSRKYSKDNRNIKTAQLKVYRAIKSGRMTRQPCEVCGSPLSQAHHEDYSKPLEVKWLCSKHHNRVHKWIETTVNTPM